MLDNDKGGWWGSKSESLGMEVFLGGGVDGGFRQSLVIAPDEAEMKPEEEHWTLPASAKAQPMVFDADSSLRPSLLGYQAASPSMDAILMAWANNGTGLTMWVWSYEEAEGCADKPQADPTATVSWAGMSARGSA
jgi:integrin alpha FG-GAP repeat containing protein 1